MLVTAEIDTILVVCNLANVYQNYKFTSSFVLILYLLQSIHKITHVQNNEYTRLFPEAL